MINLKAMEEAAKSDASFVVHTPTHPSHQRKLKEERVKKGEYITSEAAMVAKKIDSLEELFSQGSFTQSDRMDILATTIGKPDHSDRVRGVRKGINIRKFLGSPSRSSSEMMSRAEVEELVAKITKETVPATEKRLREEFNAYRSSTPTSQAVDFADQATSPNIQSSKNSCCPLGSLVHVGPDDAPEKGVPCFLLLEYPNKRIVIDGKYTQGSTVHDQQVQEDQVRVEVDSVRPGEEDKEVMIPSAGITLGAKGSFIIWPEKLVATMTKQTKQPVPQLPPIDMTKYPYMALLRENVTTMEDAISIKIPAGIVGLDLSYEISLDKVDLMELLTIEKLDISLLKLAIL